MRAMRLEAQRAPLELREVPVPQPAPGQILIRVEACAVCRTDLHVFDGELPQPKLPLTLGHQIVGKVERVGAGATRFKEGVLVGVPWLGWVDGICRYCRSGRENLCDNGKFTGYQIDGGYAEYAAANEAFCFPIPDGFTPEHAAPLLCGGLIGYRSYKIAVGPSTPGRAQRARPSARDDKSFASSARGDNSFNVDGEPIRLGLYGFGSAAHMITQVARFEGRRVFAFTRPGDEQTQRFARDLGAEWAGGSDQKPPEELDAAIILAPVGDLVPQALRVLAKGGVVVCGGIHMSDIPSLPYELLWNERQIRSVANLTREDGKEFLALAERAKIRTEITIYPLERANEALEDLRHGRFRGTAVLVP